VYDEAMKKHMCVRETHPEQPARISRIHSRMRDYGLLEKCVKLPSRLVTEAEIKLVHRRVNNGIRDRLTLP